MRAALSGIVALACSACVADAPYPDALASVGSISAQLAQSVSAAPGAGEPAGGSRQDRSR